MRVQAVVDLGRQAVPPVYEVTVAFGKDSVNTTRLKACFDCTIIGAIRNENKLNYFQLRNSRKTDEANNHTICNDIVGFVALLLMYCIPTQPNTTQYIIFLSKCHLSREESRKDQTQPVIYCN